MTPRGNARNANRSTATFYEPSGLPRGSWPRCASRSSWRLPTSLPGNSVNPNGVPSHSPAVAGSARLLGPGSFIRHNPNGVASILARGNDTTPLWLKRNSTTFSRVARTSKPLGWRTQSLQDLPKAARVWWVMVSVLCRFARGRLFRTVEKRQSTGAVQNMADSRAARRWHITLRGASATATVRRRSRPTRRRPWSHRRPRSPAVWASAARCWPGRRRRR